MIGPSIISGSGPAGAIISIKARAPDEKDLQLLAQSTTADSSGRWETIAFADFSVLSEPPAPGPYEIYAAIFPDVLTSRPITIFYRDTTPTREATRIISARYHRIEICYELYTAFVQATKLKRRRCLLSRSIVVPVDDLEATAVSAGEQIATCLHQLVARQPLDVRVTIDADRYVHFDPGTAWGLYYAFPKINQRRRARRKTQDWPAPSTDVHALYNLRVMQTGWELLSHVSQIPERPFRRPYTAAQTYLEVRHDGYRPEFVRLEEAFPRTYTVRLSPVLQKRIAVLNFPCTAPDQQATGFSQLIARSMAVAIERRPELAPFAYFAVSPTDRAGYFLNRPPIEFGNQVLTLEDVQAVQSELESIDTHMISGEGRHLARKAMDIQFLVRGSYRLLNKD